MFTIMENRKRPRLELIQTNNNISTDTMQGVASTASTMSTATLATIGGQSFLLSNSTASSLPANILLSICDDNSDESEEYIIDSSMLTQIKHENTTVATQTSNNTQQQQQATLLAATTTLPQYRIINQAGKILNNNSLSTNARVNNTTSSSSIISNSVHLPPGCEIYVIKECIDSPKHVIAESTLSPKQLGNNTTIKLEPMSPLPASAAGSFKIVRNSSSINGHTTQNLKTNTNNLSSITLNASSAITPTSATSSSGPAEDTVKRSLILEAYKKRDDKRRATHNEVERRRRDKINSWIFKLKEMLPSELTPSNSFLNNDSSSSSCANQTASNHNSNTRLLVQQGTAARTPPSDSKSQILIKACEYIKTMQEEIQSLRECLTENENLRLSNERLQDEINTLRNKQQLHNLHHNNNNILLNTNSDNEDCEITLNSLNATYANVQLFAPTSTNNNISTNLTGLVGLTTTNSNNTTPTVNVTYAKRELIIRDYVD